MTKVQDPLSDYVLSKADFDQCDWLDVILNSQKKDCLHYFSNFTKRANEAAKSGDATCQKVFALLSVICLPRLMGGDKDAPFAPMKHIERLNDDLLEALRKIVPEMSDAEFQARIADILWIRKRDHIMAECAIKSYIASSVTLEQAGQGVLILDRTERAMRLAISLNNDTLLADVVSHIESLLVRCDHDRCETPTLLLMRAVEQNRNILQPYQQLNPSEYAALAERAAVREESGRNWIAAEQYLSITAAWLSPQEDGEKIREVRIRGAETFVRASEDALERRTPPSYLVAHHFLQQAILAYREIPGTNDRVQELHKLLLEYGDKTLAEMQIISVEQEIGREIIERAVKRVQGKTKHEALFWLAFSHIPPAVAYLRKAALEAIKDYPLQFLFQRKTFNESGKVIAYNSGATLSDTENEATVQGEMFRNAQSFQQYAIVAAIEPARRQIIQEHEIRLEDLYPFVMNNPFIPHGRERIFALGLYHGLTGDFLISTHLLFPQLENSIRSLLSREGKITSKLDYKGIQQEHNLNTLLYKPYAPILENILGEDLVFDLRGLLVEEYGSNVRNKLAHGLIDSGWFSSTEAEYLWWIALHLCCRPFFSVLLSYDVGAFIGPRLFS